MNILITGVGGQGTILASKLLAKDAIARGEMVRTAETIAWLSAAAAWSATCASAQTAIHQLCPKANAT